jgi:Fe2+ or Zn2+ uptake regulation protein
MSAYDPKRKTISSCVIVPADVPKIAETGPKLTKNQQTMYSILRDAGPGGLTADQWNERLREAGIGTQRKADIYDARAGLKAKNLVREFNGRWRVPYED